MKNIKSLSIIAAVIFLSAACAKETIDVPQQIAKSEITTKTFTAIALGNSDNEELSKTNIRTDGRIEWAEGDIITIYDAAGNSANYTVTAAQGTAKVTELEFSVDLGDGPYYAVEHRSKVPVTYDNASHSFMIRHINASTGAWSSSDAMVASSETTALVFRHVTGWMNFLLTGKAKKVHVRFDKGAFGAYNVTFPSVGEEPVIRENEADVFCDTAMVRERTDYTFPVIPGTYKFSIVLEKGEGIFEVNSTNELTVARNQYVKLGNIESRLTKLDFYDSFDGNNYLYGNDGNFNGLASNDFTATSDISGWEFTKGACGKACLFFGSSKNPGAAQTPALGIPATADSTVIRVLLSPYNNSKDCGKTLNVTVVGNGTITPSSITLGSTAGWQEYSFVLKGADPDTKVKIASAQDANNRFFMDEFKAISYSAPITGSFVKVTETPASGDWSGEYLVVHENLQYTLGLWKTSSIDLQSVAINDAKIEYSENLASCLITVAPATVTSGAYTIKYKGYFVAHKPGAWNWVQGTSETADGNWNIKLSTETDTSKKEVAGMMSIRNVNQTDRKFLYYSSGPDFRGVKENDNLVFYQFVSSK